MRRGKATWLGAPSGGGERAQSSSGYFPSSLLDQYAHRSCFPGIPISIMTPLLPVICSERVPLNRGGGERSKFSSGHIRFLIIGSVSHKSYFPVSYKLNFHLNLISFQLLALFLVQLHSRLICNLFFVCVRYTHSTMVTKGNVKRR